MEINKAIDLLDNLIGMVDDNQGNDYDAAFHMAIDALKAQEVSKDSPKVDSDFGGTVSRQAVLENVCTMLRNCFDASDEMIESVKITVGELPPSPNAPKTLDSNSQHVQRVESVADDTISRKAAIDAIEILLEQSEDDEHDKTWNNAIRGSINAVKHHVPSVQPEIIRCKDCKHYMPYEWMWDDISRSSDINDYSPDEIGCERIDHNCPPDGFCCFAERRDDG